MKHLQIILIVLNLILGTGAIFYIHQLFKKYKLSYLKYLVLFLVSLNMLVFIDFIYKYAFTIVNFDIFLSFSAFMVTFLIVILYIAEFGMTFFLYRLTIEFKDKTISKKIFYSFFAWVTTFIIASVWGVIEFIVIKNTHRFYVIHEYWIFSMILIIFIILISYQLYSYKISDLSKKRSMLAFGYIFLAAFFFFTLGQLDYYTTNFLDGYYMDHFFLILLNISPLVWISFYFVKPEEIPQLNMPDEQKLDNFNKLYNISAREKEIIELLIKGKTNKEIEAELFISYNTVKNHIYAVFKKTGVNSRAQLINLIQRFEDKV